MGGGWAYLDWPSPIPFAHRGGAAEYPENTMSAFAAAIDLGYRYLETDVHVTSDGVLVAFHDDVVDRVTDGRGRIEELPYAKVRELRVQGHAIPLLEDILGAWPEARVNIDAKHDICVPTLVEAIDRTGAHDRVCLGAFSTRRSTRLRRMTNGRVCTWMGRSEILRLRLASFRFPMGALATPCAQVPVRQGGFRLVDRQLVDAAHRRGIAVHAWTINDRAEMEALLDLGVDGIMSDRPSVLKAVFVNRGLWP